VLHTHANCLPAFSADIKAVHTPREKETQEVDFFFLFGVLSLRFPVAEVKNKEEVKGQSLYSLSSLLRLFSPAFVHRHVVFERRSSGLAANQLCRRI
jgi:hypothetical protein